jgi:hypothetical protein
VRGEGLRMYLQTHAAALARERALLYSTAAFKILVLRV